MGPRRAAALAATALALGGCGLSDEAGGPGAPPQFGPSTGEDETTRRLGVPFTATKNTTRVSGADSAADVAGAARAVFPATSPQTRPDAVALVDSRNWQGGIAAAVLMAEPTVAPILLSEGDDLPAVTSDTLKRLDPRGSRALDGAQVIAVGDQPPPPEGRKVTVIRGREPYGLAAAIDRFSARVRGKPSPNVIVTTGEDPAWAMPAAAWAARSGDAILFTRRNALPAATARALREHEKPNIFLVGPEAIIGKQVERALARLGRVRRIDGPTPVLNAIEFARYQEDGFGWGITVPGYNFTLASTSRPLDAAGAAAFASNGVFSPLLLTDDPLRLPRTLESYLLDVQPGYQEDPGRAVYNRMWVLGDERAISLGAQGRIDEITELVPVDGSQPVGAPPGAASPDARPGPARPPRRGRGGRRPGAGRDRPPDDTGPGGGSPSVDAAPLDGAGDLSLPDVAQP